MNIIAKRKYAYIFSGILTLLSVVFLSIWGLRLGIDFKGGVLMEMKFSAEKNVQKNQLEEALSELGLSSLQIQATENNSYIIRYAQADEESNNKVMEKMKGVDENYQQVKADFIGGSVSGQMKKNAIIALVLAVIGIALYIAWAFNKVSYPISSWQYGIGAIIALAHDILITLGFFSMLGQFWNVEVGVPFIAALLTILGYSVNDTIVVYDRTRENLIKSSRSEDFESIVNRSLNETLARSINTSLTVIIMLIAIVVFGGESIRNFAVALLVGIGFGTYSSIYVATALLVTSYRIKMKN
ncbi:MAG: hypothetical protein ACD_11C00024G0025 [uncultured bacterium]|nr:MAG: hypothetical protein ACD_11C00024G0025 [uncultured bacterium]HBR71947.1 protein translocase subunit SecF [Candidatus Moranbacteria bacterium]